MNPISTTLRVAALAVGLASTAAHAASPVGVWIDHTGRGAVEIAECGDGLCGHVVWVKEAKNAKACRDQILGNVKAVGANTWDRGWIVDPDNNARYSVELKPVGEDRLRVMGYMGSKLFSETMTWKRAPADLKRCDGKEAAVPVQAPAAPAVIVQSTETGSASSQREVRAPVVGSASPAAPAIEAVPSPPDRVAAAVSPPQPELQPASRSTSPSGGNLKPVSRDCKLNLGYISVTFPCDAL